MASNDTNVFWKRNVFRPPAEGRSLAYIVTRDGVSNIWSVAVDGGAPRQLTNFTSDQIAFFDLSRDGKPTLFSRGATTKDVVLISGFKKLRWPPRHQHRQPLQERRRFEGDMRVTPGFVRDSPPATARPAHEYASRLVEEGVPQGAWHGLRHWTVTTA